MSYITAAKCPFFNRNFIVWLLGFSAASLVLVSVANGQVEGFTEPFRKIDLSSDESGAIAELYVDEGQMINAGQPVCKLDSSVQEIQVEIAKHLAKSHSSLQVAIETYQKRKSIHARIGELQNNGHATDSEKLRSEMELSIAKSKVLAAQEEATVREIEYRRAIMQLERRIIRAPFSGIVSEVHKREGEFLSPLHPEMVTLIQVDKLLAKFSVPSSQIDIFTDGAVFKLHMLNGKSIEATVHSVGVFTDARSGTVVVKLVIDNSKGEIRAGEFLTLEI